MLRLTFDDGPSEWTPPILDLLSKYGVKATFFVVGQSIAGREAILRRIVAEGHEVGNHTFTHRKLTDHPAGLAIHELRACQEVIALTCRYVPVLWRAPAFARDEEIDRAAGLCGLAHVGADIVPDDWNLKDADEIADRVLGKQSPGAVVCLHDGIPPGGGNGTNSRQPTVDAVRLILETSGLWART